MPLRKVTNPDLLDALKDREDARRAGISDKEFETITQSRGYQSTRKDRKAMGLKRSSGFSGATDQDEGSRSSSFFRGMVGKPLEAVSQMITHGGNKLQRAVGMDPNKGMFGGQGMFSDADVAYVDAQPRISAAREAKARQRRGRTGYDVAETVGSFFTPGPKLAKVNPIVRGIGQGAVGAALEPVMDTKQGYGTGLAKQAGIGGGIGGTVGAVFGMPGRAVGKEAAEVAENVARGKRLGVDLGLAEASHSRPVRMVSDLVGNTIVGSQIPDKAERTLQALDSTMKRTVNDISGGAGRGMTEYGTGQTITSGLNKAVDRFKGEAERLYGAVTREVPQGTRVRMVDVVDAMRGPAKRFASNPALGEELANSRLMRIANHLESQAPGGRVIRKMDFNEAQELRSEIGRLIGQPELVSSIPKGELQQVYKALTQAMGDSLQGTPKAAAAWDAANTFYKAGRDRIDTFIEPALKGDAPEQATKHVLGAIRKNADAVTQLRGQMSPDEWDEVVGYSLRDLGLPSFANRGADNEGFSLGKFLTEYNKLRDNPEAFEAAFKGTKFEANKGVFDDLAGLAENVKRTGDLANKSRSGYTAGNYALISSLFANPLLFLKLGGGTLAASHFLSSPTMAKGVAAMGRTYVKHGGKGRVLNKQLKQMAARLAVADRSTPEEEPQQ